MDLNTYVLKIDGLTRETTTVGGITVLGAFPIDLQGTDMAVLGPGIAYMSSNSRGLYRWDVNPLGDASGDGFSPGTFDEVQIVVPEPASVAALSLGLAALALRARSRRRR